MLEAATEDNSRGLEAAVDILGQSIDTPLTKLGEEGELRRAADRTRLQDSIEASETRILTLASGILRHLSEEGKKHKEAMSAETERVSAIADNNGAAAEDMGGGLRELTEILRDNGREKKRLT